MIPQTQPIRQAETVALTTHHSDSWQQALANVIRQPQQLFELLQLDLQHLPAAVAACQDFPLRVPLAFAERMVKGDWNDPLLRQVLPLGRELDLQPGFSQDPLQEANSNPPRLDP